MAEPKVQVGFKMGGDKSKKRKAPTPVLSAFASGVSEEPTDEREFVTSMAGGTIESKNKKTKTGPIVIPLIENPWAAKETDSKMAVAAAPGDDKPAEEPAAPHDQYSEAARAIIEDLQGSKAGDIKDTTKFAITTGKGLHVQDDGMAKDATVASDAAPEEGDIKKKNLPILIANMVPGLDKLDDVTEKFRHDMSMRAENQDPSGDRYAAVPVSLFGEAALRGMGWAGEIDDAKFKAPDVRPGRLGLGATPKPPESKKDRRPGSRKKDGARAAQDEKSRAHWEEKRLEKERENQRGKVFFAVEDMVEVYAGPQKGKRGIIRQTEGVPGLENVRLQFEGTKEIVIVSNKHIDLLSAEKLEDAPFKKTPLVEMNTDADRFYKGVEKKSDAAPLKSKQERERERNRDKDPDRPRDRNRDREKDAKKNSKTSHPEKKSSKNGQREDPQWVVPFARVRVVSQKIGQGKYFKKKGVIQDVVSYKLCLLKMDESGKILEDIKQNVLETVIPTVGKQIIVVSRNHKHYNMVGKLLEKNTKKEKAYVQLDDVSDVQKFQLDEISEYTG